MSGQNSIVTIDVLVATFRRPLLLRDLLESLRNQVLPAETRIRVIIVDNDRLESARSTVTTVGAAFPFPILYDVEPEQNISLARNRCLSHVDAEYVAFIDDDERADPRWLSELLAAMGSYGADVVFGPVLKMLPSDTPKWIREGGFFCDPCYRSGTQMETGGTGNVIIRTSSIRSMKMLFNPVFGLIGGEDHDLFVRIRSAGGKLVWCDGALVYETVPSERISARYLLLRALRSGQAFAIQLLPQLTTTQKAAWLIYRVTLLFVALVLVAIGWPVRRCWGIRAMQKVFANFGQLSALTSFRCRQYEQR